MYFLADSADCCFGRASGLCAAGEGLLGALLQIAPELRGLKISRGLLAFIKLSSFFPALFSIEKIIRQHKVFFRRRAGL
jgi:hypothetical protein